MRTIIYLVRHGSVVGAETRRFIGHLDVPLSPTGEAEAAAFEAWMADVGRFQFPGGESLADVSARAWPAFENIAARHPGSRILVVAHGGPNRILLCRALGIRPERILALGQDYAALSVLERDPSGWALRLLNHREPGG